MRTVLLAALIGGTVGTASAANFDSRLYLSPSLEYVVTDPGRGVDNDFGLALTFGLPMSSTLNYELDLGYDDLDGTKVFTLNAGVLKYLSAEHPGVFATLRGGVLAADDDIGSDYFGPNITGGLGLMLPGWGGRFRLEALARADLHYDNDAGLGGKRAFVEPLFRLGYTIPLGSEPGAASPEGETVDVVAPVDADSDGDGIGDAADLCPGTPLGTVVDSTGCAAGSASNAENNQSECREPRLDEAVDEYGCAVDKAVILNGVNFEFDSDILTIEAREVLDDVADVLQTMPDAVIEIAGHTSDEGDEYYNIDLSQRRAAAVRRYLIGAGVDPSRLRAKGYGDEAPLASNDSYQGRKQNRRVEVKIIG